MDRGAPLFATDPEEGDVLIGVASRVVKRPMHETDQWTPVYAHLEWLRELMSK